MKNSPNKQQLLAYYDARAPEYEEFYDGGHPVKIPNRTIVRKEIDILKELLPQYVGGRCIDIACGTGYWLPVYKKGCTRITLIDQSEKALYECSNKISKLGIEHKTEVLRQDIFSCPFAQQLYDSAIIAFLISHLTDEEISSLFTIIKSLLIPGSKFVVMDKSWDEIRKVVHGSKAGMVKRTLKDGRQFEILNRYFEKQDLQDLAESNDINLEIIYWGNVFFLAAGRFRDV